MQTGSDVCQLTILNHPVCNDVTGVKKVGLSRSISGAVANFEFNRLGVGDMGHGVDGLLFIIFI